MNKLFQLILKSTAIFLFAVLAATSAQGATLTNTFDLGPYGTPTTLGGDQSLPDYFVPWSLGSLPPGSVLRSVSINATLEDTDQSNWISELMLLVEPASSIPGSMDGILEIGPEWNPDFGSALKSFWSTKGDVGPIHSFTDTKTAGVDFPVTIDLSDANLFLMNAYGPGYGEWSGTLSVTYDVPGTVADMVTFGPDAIITGTNIAWEVLLGTDLTTLAPIYTMSYGATCPKGSGVPQDFSLGPVHYILTSSDSLVTKDYLVTVTAVPERLIWSVGGDGDWDPWSPFWTGQYSGLSMLFADGLAVVFNDILGGTITVTPEGVAPLSTTVSAASGTFTFTGGAIGGSGSLTKSGGGTLVLGATNTYTGKTIVQGGTLATALGADYLSNAGEPGVFGAPTGADAIIDLYNGVILLNNGSNPRLNQATDRPLNLAGTGPGTVTIRVNDNDTSFTFGAVTATGTGAKTLALFTGCNGNGDRESLIFTGAIADSSDGSPTSLEVTFRTQTASTSFVCLSGVNTFTGPITLTPYDANPTGSLVIGGVRAAQNGANTVGTGTLGNGNYPGAISLGAKTILEYDSTAAQILAGPISGVGALTKTGSGLLTLAGTNTYSGNTTVSAGTLVLGDTGELAFYLTDTANNKITGAGTATLNGRFSIDTSAVGVPTGSWTLVDAATKTFGASFGLTGFTGPVGNVFTKVDGLSTWTFDTTTAVLSLTAPALITSLGIPDSACAIDQGAAKTIVLYVPLGTDLATLAPTFTLSSGTCNQTSGSAPSPTFAAANPTHYIVTAGAIINDYTVTVVPSPLPLNGLTVWLKADAINPADTNQVDDLGGVLKWIDQSGHGNNATKGSAQPAPVYFASTLNGEPVLRFTQSGNDNGSRLYLGDLSAQFPTAASLFTVGTIGTPDNPTDGRYTLFGNRGNDERWVADSWTESHPGSFRTGRAGGTFIYDSWPQMDSHVFVLESSSTVFRMLLDGTEIGSDSPQYNTGSGANWNIGNRFSTTGNDAQLNGDIPELILYNRVLSAGEAAQVGAYLTAKYGLITTYPGPAEIVALGIPGSDGVIDSASRTIALTVPWTPWGTSGLATLAPAFALTSGTCVPASGVAPTPTFAANPTATYTVTDGATVNAYTVTVTVAPPRTENAMSNPLFPGVGYAWTSDDTGTNFVIYVPSATAVTALAPTYTVSPGALGSPGSGTARNFTTPQTYTVTAEDGASQAYSVTVQKITTVASGYQGLVLAAGPVSYWPLNETSGTTAFDIASGLNNATYTETAPGTYTLGAPGLRGNNGVYFNSTNGAASAAAPLNASLNPAQSFTVECWTVRSNLSAAYIVSLQDRTTGSRIGYAIQVNNSAGFNFTYGVPPNGQGTINSTTLPAIGVAYHVAVTYDGSTFRMYVNGALESQASSLYLPASADQPGFTIGSRNDVTTVDGLMQDVALYGRALTPQEILSHAQYAPSSNLQIGITDGQVVLTWAPGSASLQAAPVVIGPYTNVPAVTSPWTNTPAAGSMFYRLKF